MSKPYPAARSFQVAEYVESLIRHNVYQPGDKLPSLQEMAELLKVSKSTIREALSRLQARGIITVAHGKGYFVASKPSLAADIFPAKDLGEILFVRILLEVPAAALAARNRTPAQLERMKQLVETMEAAPDDDDGVELDLSIHLTIAEASQNQMLQNVIYSLVPLMKSTMKFSRAIYGTHSALYKRHRDLYLAVEQQDEQLAAQQIAANVGAVVMPWMIFYQQSAVADKGLHPEDYRAARWDTALGSVITQAIMAAILVATAATIGIRNPNAPLNTVQQIAHAFIPYLGNYWGRVVFSLGIIGAGMIAAIVASLAGAWGWGEVTGFKHSLEHHPLEAPWF